MERPAAGKGPACRKCGGSGVVTKTVKGVKTSLTCGACKGSGSSGYLTK